MLEGRARGALPHGSTTRAQRGESLEPGILATYVLAVPIAIPVPCRKVVAVLKLLVALEK